jgi:prevent-host-death family protein
MNETRAAGKARHVSIRVSDDLFERLELLAGERDETVSQCARRLLERGLSPAPRDAIDDAITALEIVRGRVAASTASSVPERVADASTGRTVNIMNAKTNLSRLIADVSRGEEVVISHAGAPRARLVPFDPAVADAE